MPNDFAPGDALIVECLGRFRGPVGNHRGIIGRSFRENQEKAEGDSIHLQKSIRARRDGKEYEVVLPDDVQPGERVKVTLEKEVLLAAHRVTKRVLFPWGEERDTFS